MSQGNPVQTQVRWDQSSEAIFQWLPMPLRVEAKNRTKIYKACYGPVLCMVRFPPTPLIFLTYLLSTLLL